MACFVYVLLIEDRFEIAQYSMLTIIFIALF